MKILLAEDDSRLGELIAHMLQKKAGWTVEWVKSGDEALYYAENGGFDLLVLDWMMPVLDGLTVCRRLRTGGYSGAILMLTARDALRDRVEGLETGADDYVVKPFEIDELIARIRALARRNFAPLQEDNLTIGHLVLNRNGQSVSRDEQRLQLTPREFQLLDLLVRNRNIVLSREVILDRIWGLEADVNLKTIDATVKLLRKKLDSIGSKDAIRSIRGVGYTFEA